MAVSGLNIMARLTGKLTKTLADGTVPVQDYQAGLYKVTPSDADLLFNNRYTVSNGGSTDLDLAGSLEDALGTVLTFARIYAIYLHNRSTTASDVLNIGGDANGVPVFADTSDIFVLGPNGVFMVTSPVDGWTVTASTGDILQIANPGGNDIDVDVAILGRA